MVNVHVLAMLSPYRAQIGFPQWQGAPTKAKGRASRRSWVASRRYLGTRTKSIDVLTNRFLKTCEISEEIPQQLARRAAVLRASARRGLAVDAVVVAVAEPRGAVLSGDLADLRALAAHAGDVVVLRA
jgi:hypothetical protein